jgi:DNA topoisomerase-1
VRSKSESRRNIVRAIEQVAQRLGNTPSICKKCYVHPVILDAYPDGSLAAAFLHKNRTARPRLNSLRPEEAAVLALLQRHLKQSADDTLAVNLAKSLRRWPAGPSRRRPSKHKTSVMTPTRNRR